MLLHAAVNRVWTNVDKQQLPLEVTNPTTALPMLKSLGHKCENRRHGIAVTGGRVQ